VIQRGSGIGRAVNLLQIDHPHDPLANGTGNMGTHLAQVRHFVLEMGIHHVADRLAVKGLTSRKALVENAA
jgi:hypothetical protein